MSHEINLWQKGKFNCIGGPAIEELSELILKNIWKTFGQELGVYISW